MSRKVKWSDDKPNCCAYCCQEYGALKICQKCMAEIGLENSDEVSQFLSGAASDADLAEKMGGRSSHRSARDHERPTTQNHSLGEGHTQMLGWHSITILKRDYDE